MKRKMISLLFIISTILLFNNIIPVCANQISVIGSATDTTTTQQTVEIPAGSYHVYIETSGDIGYGDLVAGYGDVIAYCIATSDVETVFSWSTNLDSDTWTGQVTFPSTTAITFTFEIQGGFDGDHMNFQIVFTDIDVATITKSSIIAESPYAIEIIFIALVAVTLIYIQKRRGK